MIITLSIIILGTLWIIYSSISFGIDDLQPYFVAIGLLLFMNVSVVVIEFAPFFLPGTNPTSSLPGDEYSLSSMTDNIGYTGSFFLGTGNINSSPIYVAYVVLKDDSGQPYKTMMKFDADESRVYEDAAPNTGKLKLIRKKQGSFLWTWFIRNSFVRYEFHIPPGSIRNHYTMDSE